MLQIKFTPHGQKDLIALPKDIQNRIVEKLEFYSAQPVPLTFAKPLYRLPPSTHRFRIGPYRVAFFIHLKTLFVERVAHRREVYM